MSRQEEWVENIENKAKSVYNILKELEWVEEWDDRNDEFYAICPYCKMSANIGHGIDCKLDRALKIFKDE